MMMKHNTGTNIVQTHVTYPRSLQAKKTKNNKSFPRKKKLLGKRMGKKHKRFEELRYVHTYRRDKGLVGSMESTCVQC